LKENELQENKLFIKDRSYQLSTRININRALTDALNNAKIGYCILQNRANKEGIFIEVNEIFAKMVGYEKEYIIGRNYREILHPVSQSLIHGRFRKREMGKKLPTQYELLANQKNGRLATLEVNESITKYKGKKATILIIKDITIRKKLEHSLIKEVMSRIFCKFISNILLLYASNS
jgi:PAS domain S-box-containing protein